MKWPPIMDARLGRPLLMVMLLALAACSPNGCTPSQPANPPGKTSDGETVPPDTETESETGGETEIIPPDPTPEPVSWPHEPAGTLAPGSGSGSADPTIWAPGMRFPMEAAPAFANSQVYGYGGYLAPGPGGQCDSRNYSYPWRDNFCETRSWDNGMCPAGRGHQGQDIRPATCERKKHWVVAPETGTITSISSYTVTLLGLSGRIYRFLHMDMAGVRALFPAGGSRGVVRGQRLGQVSNDFGGTATTIHLHFEIKAPVTASGGTAVIFVPTYPSLVDSYGRLLLVSPTS